MEQNENTVLAEEKVSEAIEYHLAELELASDENNPRRLLPPIADRHQTILDIGCGIGQTFIASNLAQDSKRTLIGLDYDMEPLSYGKKKYANIEFLNAEGGDLPIRSESVDLVISRVSLPYTHIPSAIAEIHRVLKPGGEMWITLHPFKVMINPLIKSVQVFSIKGVLVRLFFMLNGIWFHLSGKLIANPKTGTYESFQTNRAMSRVLSQNKFEDIEISRAAHFLISAKKSTKLPKIY